MKGKVNITTKTGLMQTISNVLFVLDLKTNDNYNKRAMKLQSRVEFGKLKIPNLV